MQTFLPLVNFYDCGMSLDLRRHGKQRLEARQILAILEDGKYPRYRNHTAVLMWRGFEGALRHYYNAILRSWIDRGRNNNMRFLEAPNKFHLPPFIGCNKFHLAYQSHLLRKDLLYYRLRFPDTPDDIPLIWPTKVEDYGLFIGNPPSTNTATDN
jgi:hypothetical protein